MFRLPFEKSLRWTKLAADEFTFVVADVFVDIVVAAVVVVSRQAEERKNTDEILASVRMENDFLVAKRSSETTFFQIETTL